MPESSPAPAPAKNNVRPRHIQRSKPARAKLAKPYPAFPLFPHATFRWAKKIRGRFAFFGPWEDPHGALERFLAEKDHLMAGLTPRARAASATVPEGRGGVPATDGAVTVRDLINHFLTAKQRRVESGELGQRSFADYHILARRVIDQFSPHRLAMDLLPDDFAQFRRRLATTRGPLALGADITKVRGIFKHGYESGLLEKPMRFGAEFDKPSQKSIRLVRAAGAKRMFEAEEVRALLAGASPQVRAMILLGINCGMGNTDLCMLRRLGRTAHGENILDYPRPKTGVARRAPLWPETVEALEVVAACRPAAKAPEHADLVFITKYGAPWVRVQPPAGKRKSVRTAVTIDGISLEFGKLMRAVGVHTPGRGFYALRHTFRTVADEVRDRPAVDLIMGHENSRDVSTNYIERIGDGRLRQVTEHVRRWVFQVASAESGPSRSDQ